MAHIGLLEDNSRIATLCATILQYEGHTVTIYRHPRECLQHLFHQSEWYTNKSLVNPRSTKPPVDVLVLDLHLPDIDGVEVLKSLRSHAPTRKLPLVFCTAASSSEIARALAVAPNAHFVEKPFKFQALISAVTKVLKADAAVG